MSCRRCIQRHDGGRRRQEFFGLLALSQYLDQTPACRKSRTSDGSHWARAGLTRERAGFEVRDVPRPTTAACARSRPRRTNIGLINSLSVYAAHQPVRLPRRRRTGAWTTAASRPHRFLRRSRRRIRDSAGHAKRRRRQSWAMSWCRAATSEFTLMPRERSTTMTCRRSRSCRWPPR